MRTFYDQAHQRLVVEMQRGDPVGDGVAVPGHQAVREYRDQANNILKYVVSDVGNQQQAISDLAYGWMTANPGVGMEKNDLEAVKLLKEWCTWLVAIETGVIAALGVMQKDINLSGLVYEIARYVAGITIVALGVSIFVAIHMLLALPAMAQRLPPPPPIDNDIYSLQNPVTHRRLSTYVRWVRWSSVVGLASFAVLLFLVVVFK